MMEPIEVMLEEYKALRQEVITPSRGGQPAHRCDGQLPPPSQTRACGITALGSSDMTPRTGPGPSDIRPLKRIRSKQLLIATPGQRFTTGPPVEPLSPELSDSAIKLPQTPEVRRAPVVLVVAPQPRVESRPLLRDRLMAVSLAPRRSPFEAPAQPLPHRPNVDGELPPPASRTDVGKAQKVKRAWLRPPALVRLRQSLAPKLDQASLARMQPQPVLLESLSQHRQDSLRILPILKTENEVVRVPDFIGFAPQPRLHHVLKPLIEHVVQVNVGQQRANDLPLAHPRLRHQQPSVLQHPGLDPLPDQPENAPVVHPFLDQLHELTPHDRVKVRPDVCFQNIADRPPTDYPADLVERFLRTAPRTEAVRTLPEVLLVDRREQFQRGPLHDLVLQDGNGERSPRPFLLLRDIDPAQRLRPVLPTCHPIVELLQILPDVHAVLRVRDPIHACARFLPQTCPGALQRRHRQKMSDRGKLQCLVRPSQFGYSVESR